MTQKTEAQELTLTAIYTLPNDLIEVEDFLTTLSPKQLAFEQTLIKGAKRVIVLDDSRDAEYRLLFDSLVDF